MTLEQTPAPARSDVRRSATVGAPRAPVRPFVKQGMTLTAGAVSWAIYTLIFGTDPSGRTEEALSSLTSGLFQVGLLCLLTVQWRTQALGEGRLARFFLRAEAVLITLAIGSTIVDGIGVSDLDRVGWILLDLTWPLSMLGMFAIGVRIAIAGRWHGASRFWPLLAESWAVVVVPTFSILGSDAAGYVSFVHLCVGYGVLGQLVARKER